MTRSVYLDYNATAPLRAEARAAVVDALMETGNPSSVHRFGQAARRRVEDARDAVAALAGVAPAQVIFTSGATEANNTVLAPGNTRRILASAIEHDSVLAAVDAERVPVTPAGVVDLDALDAMLAASTRPALVAVMAANNETGVIQPVAEAAAVAHRHGAVLHCDAVQLAGKAPLDFARLGADSLSLSAHKLGGPQAVGALVVRDGLEVPRLLRGGGQERRRRAGTENVAGIAGFGAAARAALAGLRAYGALAALRDGLERRIAAACPDAMVFGQAAPRIANTSCIVMPGVAAETQLMGFDLAGIAVSAGAACSSGKVAASHVLQAMGADTAAANGAVRVSLGWDTGPDDVDRFVEAWLALYRRAAKRGGTIAAA
ncbi:MAG: cysteine desulfurase family protein [Alphaproteobacteria bacterium]